MYALKLSWDLSNWSFCLSLKQSLNGNQKPVSDLPSEPFLSAPSAGLSRCTLCVASPFSFTLTYFLWQKKVRNRKQIFLKELHIQENSFLKNITSGATGVNLVRHASLAQRCCSCVACAPVTFTHRTADGPQAQSLRHGSRGRQTIDFPVVMGARLRLAR